MGAKECARAASYVFLLRIQLLILYCTREYKNICVYVQYSVQQGLCLIDSTPLQKPPVCPPLHFPCSQVVGHRIIMHANHTATTTKGAAALVASKACQLLQFLQLDVRLLCLLW